MRTVSLVTELNSSEHSREGISVRGLPTFASSPPRLAHELPEGGVAMDVGASWGSHRPVRGFSRFSRSGHLRQLGSIQILPWEFWVKEVNHSLGSG